MTLGVAQADQPIPLSALNSKTSASDWLAIPLENGWTGWGDVNFHTPQYLVQDGWVYLRGLLKNTSGNNLITNIFPQSTLAYTSDKSYSFTHETRHPIMTSSGPGVLYQSGGQWTDFFGTTATNGWLSLDGVAFPLVVGDQTVATSGGTLGSTAANGRIADPIRKTERAATFASDVAPGDSSGYTTNVTYISSNRGGVNGSLFVSPMASVNKSSTSTLMTIHADHRPLFNIDVPVYVSSHYGVHWGRLTTGGIFWTAATVEGSTFSPAFIQTCIPQFRAAKNFSGGALDYLTQPNPIGTLSPTVNPIETTWWYPQSASIPLADGWTDNGPTGRLRANKTAKGLVSLGGSVRGISATGNQVGTVPVGYRPSKTILANCATDAGNGAPLCTQIRIYTSGYIEYWGGNRPSELFLDSIHYHTY